MRAASAAAMAASRRRSSSVLVASPVWQRDGREMDEGREMGASGMRPKQIAECKRTAEPQRAHLQDVLMLAELRRRLGRPESSLHVAWVQSHSRAAIPQRVAPVAQLQVRLRPVGQVHAVCLRVRVPLCQRLGVAHCCLPQVERRAQLQRLVAPVLCACVGGHSGV